jgi:uncharacterized protein YegJ (DUF2314 family)
MLELKPKAGFWNEAVRVDIGEVTEHDWMIDVRFGGVGGVGSISSSDV